MFCVETHNVMIAAIFMGRFLKSYGSAEDRFHGAATFLWQMQCMSQLQNDISCVCHEVTTGKCERKKGIFSSKDC